MLTLSPPRPQNSSTHKDKNVYIQDLHQANPYTLHHLGLSHKPEKT